MLLTYLGNERLDFLRVIGVLGERLFHDAVCLDIHPGLRIVGLFKPAADAWHNT